MVKTTCNSGIPNQKTNKQKNQINKKRWGRENRDRKEK